MASILRHLIFVAVGASVTFIIIGSNEARAFPIGPSNFGPSAIVESFEGLSPGPNIPLIPGGGILKPGVDGPFTFSSGVILTGPLPNEFPPSARRVLVGDFSIGNAGLALGENGHIASANDVPDGSAYLALNANPGPIEFTFPSDVVRVGGFVTGGSGVVTLSAFDASDNLIERVSLSKVYVSNWDSNFVGLESSIGIHKVTFSDSDVGTGFNTLVLDRLSFEFVPSVVDVTIDIKPGSFPNSINPKSKGVILVAILTTNSFDAATVDPLSIKFGPNGAMETFGRGQMQDVDGDGNLDLVFHFRTQETGIICGSTSATLTGETFAGQPITGSDSIQAVGC